MRAMSKIPILIYVNFVSSFPIKISKAAKKIKTPKKTKKTRKKKIRMMTKKTATKIIL